MELIKISHREGKRVVSARDLYESIGLDKTHYSRWAKKNITKSSFAIENEDWVGFAIMANGNETQDFALTIDFAKRLSMMAHTKQGEKVRNYFIEKEKEANAPERRKTGDELVLDAIRYLGEKVKTQQQLIEQKEEELEKANETIQEQAPIIKYHNLVLSSTSTFHATSIGSDVGLSAKTLNMKLKQMGIQRKIDKHWVLNAKYQGKGYEDYNTIQYRSTEGEQRTAKEMVWTELGRKFVIELLTLAKAG